MQLLITGAFGNLGTMVTKQALALGHAVRCFDIDNPNTRRVAATFGSTVDTVFGDIRDSVLLEKLVSGVDAIIHNASLLPPLTETNPKLADAINVDACKTLIDIAAKQAKPPVFIFPSSVTVFGFPPNHYAVREPNDPVSATDNYTRHKLAIEEALKAQPALPWVILRVGVSVDARTLKTDRGTFRTLLNVRADNPLEYVHPMDVALAMCRAAERPAAQGKTLLIGGGHDCQVTQHQFLGTAFRALGLTLSPAVHGDKAYYTHWMNTAESESILGFQQHRFGDYEQEMADKLKWVRRGLFPLRWLVNPLLVPLLKQI